MKKMILCLSLMTFSQTSSAFTSTDVFFNSLIWVIGASGGGTILSGYLWGTCESAKDYPTKITELHQAMSDEQTQDLETTDCTAQKISFITLSSILGSSLVGSYAYLYWLSRRYTHVTIGFKDLNLCDT